MGSTAQAVREARTVWDLDYHAGLLSFHMLKGYSEDMILEHAKPLRRRSRYLDSISNPL
ncbi:dihydrodipicolinate synthetase [Desulfurococcaceae archaeon AG1]|nr:dihydrodipicolinate synthetase [Desulfurococcaceae archaeon AG1]